MLGVCCVKVYPDKQSASGQIAKLVLTVIASQLCYALLLSHATMSQIKVHHAGSDRFGSQDRFGGEFPPFAADDLTLFPPPPSARGSQPPPPPPPRTDGLSDSQYAAHVDAEREIFLAQLDSLAQDLEKVTHTLFSLIRRES